MLTRSEHEVIQLLDRALSEFKALERNEYPGPDEDRLIFKKNIETAQNLIWMRATSRERKEANPQ